MDGTILRLLITEECNRKCPGCCNNDWDINRLPIWDGSTHYKQIILTGGEPLLKPEVTHRIIMQLRRLNYSGEIILYTAYLDNFELLDETIRMLDGITLTLHTKEDADKFLKFFFEYGYQYENSLRLNIFKEVGWNILHIGNWKIKDELVWIKNCPLPENEIFMRYY